MIRKDPVRVESVHRALVLLTRIIEEGSLGVTEAAALLDVNASTAQRLLATLVHDDFAAQGRDRRYVAGPALHNPGLATRIPQLTDRLRPALEVLFERTGETVHLATLVGTRILHLDGIEARDHLVRFGLRVGVWLPAHLTSSGKALLADLSEDEVEARYEPVRSASRDSQTIVDLPALHAELTGVRANRVAWNLGQNEPGIAAMAISIGEFGSQRMALSVALPSSRFTPELGEKWSRDLIEISDAVAAESSRVRSGPGE